MAKNETKPANAEGVPAGAAAEEDNQEDTTMKVDIDATTGLPVAHAADGSFIPKIPKSFFYGDHVKVDGYEKKLAFLTYARDMIDYRITEHKAQRDPEQARKLRIAKLQAELARLTAK